MKSFTRPCVISSVVCATQKMIF